MKEARNEKLYLPAMVIMAAVLFLLLVISVSTLRNLNRQQARALEGVQGQGLTLLKVIEAVHDAGQPGVMEQLIEQLTDRSEIAYICLTRHDGTILNPAGNISDELAADIAKEIRSAPGTSLQTRQRRLADGAAVYEMIKAEPFGFMVLGINMQRIEAAHESDLHHTVTMALIVLALGASVLFFTFVIRKYYRVNQALSQNQDYTRRVIGSLASGLIRIDSAGRVESYNQMALELLGVAAETLQGHALNRLLDFQAVGIAEILTGRHSVLEKEINYTSPSGRSLPLAVSVTPIAEADRTNSGAVILLHDLSRIKSLETQVRRAEKLAAVGELAASVAHEIRNPLSSIKGFAQFLHKKFSDGAPGREYTQIMIQEVDRINAVVNNLLTFARPMKADLQMIDPLKMIGHTLRLVQADAETRNIRIETRLPAGIPMVPADANQLIQALLNLLINAMAAVKRDGTITIGTEIDHSGSEFILWVEDDGPGIAPELHEKIFEPFFTNREKGTGLGLAIVRKIVENHNGRVTVASPVIDGRAGARFMLRFPLETPEKTGRAA